MIISHNISALNTRNKLHKNQTDISKAISKLSSGLRINSASDDAAGLAISEKMRAQIRGLTQAQRNIQDGISLIQTAEGGLANIHDSLQRMRELAVQASNGTLSDTDRLAIQAEVEQIKSEIDEVANNTRFNGICLLKGTTESSQIIRETAGYHWEVFDLPAFGAYGVIPADGVYKFNNGYVCVTFYSILFSTDGQDWRIVDEIIYPRRGESFRNIITNGELLVAFGGGTLRISTDGINWTKIDSLADGQQIPLTDFINGIWDGHEFKIVGNRSYMLSSADGINWKISNINSNPQELYYDIAFNGNMYVAVGSSGTISISYDGVNWNHINLHNYLYAVEWFNDKFIVTGDNGMIAYSSDGINWEWMLGYQSPFGYNKLSCMATNGETIVVGGWVTTVNDKRIMGISKDGKNWTILDPIDTIGFNDIKFIDNEYIAVDTGGRFLRSKAITETITITNELNLQIGANSGDNFIISLCDVSTTTIGVNSISVKSQNEAQQAIEQIDGAIELVSSQRSKFGAYQNALEHINANLSNYEENLIAAESRIRDADMAKEMMNYIKYNILNQAATAVLAQANQQLKNALQLLD